MEKCTIYSHFLNLQDLFEILEREFTENFEIEITGKSDSWSKITVIDNFGNNIMILNCQKKLIPGYQLSEPIDSITKNLVGMYNFHKKIPAKNSKLKEKLLIKISSFNLQIGVSFFPKYSCKIKFVLIKLTSKLEGMIFSGENSIFNLNGASSGIFDEKGELVLDNLGRSNVTDISVEIESKYYFTLDNQKKLS